jgi:Mg2+ and Co2+ transporter CorA
MNFADDAGPTIPELTWRRGYLWFWLWCFLTSAGVVFLVKWQMASRTSMRWK